MKIKNQAKLNMVKELMEKGIKQVDIIQKVKKEFGSGVSFTILTQIKSNIQNELLKGLYSIMADKMTFISQPSEEEIILIDKIEGIING